MAEQVLQEAQRPWAPQGASLDVLYSAHPLILYDGPRGTAKTTTYLNKIFLLAHKWPGMHALILRRTMRSLRTTTLATWEEKVVPQGHPCLKANTRHSQDPRYEFGKSWVITGGLDDADKFRSADLDLVLVDEVKQIRDPDFLDTLRGCMRNNAGAYHQIALLTNPSGPRFWAIQMARDPDGGIFRIKSRLTDNPAYWDAQRGEWTKLGANYWANLQKLRGHSYYRDCLGEWRSAEGVAVPEWNEDAHLIDRFEIPKDWPRVVVVDFGHAHPMVIQWWALDEDRRAYRYREIYYTKRLVRDHVALAKRLTEEAEEEIDDIIADHDAEGRDQFAADWMPTIPAIKDRELGLQAVKERLRPAEDGRPRLFYLRDSLVERDQALADRGKPTCTEEEWDGLVFAQTAKGDEKEDIVKQNDDGYDATRYLCMYLAGAEEDMSVELL